MLAAVQRIGILGGTFDPIHTGHIESAREVVAALGLTQVFFMPCRQHPHNKQPGASAEQRLAMLQLALQGEDQLLIDDRELRREGMSYSVDSLAEIRSETGNHACIVMIMGSDAFSQLHHWHRWQDLFSLANILVIERAGQIPLSAITQPELRERLDSAITAGELAHKGLQSPAGALIALTLSPYIISSTQLRAALASEENSSALNRLGRYLPTGVLDYISQQRLYRAH